MTCRELYAFLDDFIDGSVDALTRRVFERHLDLCVSCRKYLSTYQATLKIARSSEFASDPAMAAVPEALVQAILAARSASFVQEPPE